MKNHKFLWLGLALLALNTWAQIATDPDWKETPTPPPPAFATSGLISIDMPSYVSVRLGIDPATVTLTADGIVRYVVVATNSSGSVSAMYEAIRCATGEVITYARTDAGEPWDEVKNPRWQSLSGRLPSKHALALARQGVCEGNAVAANSAPAIVNALKNPKPYDAR